MADVRRQLPRSAMLQILSSGDCSASDACSPTVCLPVDGGLRSSDQFSCSVSTSSDGCSSSTSAAVSDLLICAEMASGSSDVLPGSYGLPVTDVLPDSATRCWMSIKKPVIKSGVKIEVKDFLEQMMPEIWLGSILLLIVMMSSTAAGAFVGVNIGTELSDLPPASEVVAILKANQITHVRLFDADARMLNALSNTGIEVMVGVTNEEVLGIGESPSVAADWVNKNVAAYLPSTNITAIAVGSEVLTSIPNAAPILVPAMNYLHKALVAANLNYQVKVSTPQSMDIISRPFPPSTASFNSTWNSTIFQLLQFLKNTNSYYMLNAYPFSGYVNGNGIFPIDYALFQPLSSVKQIVDPNTLFHYNSMFDAMVDATYNSIAAFHFSGIKIVVTESGWPWHGGANEPDATTENARTFNNNLIQRVLNGSGPPSQPSFPINTYIYELFNEDKRHGPDSERNWGLFFTNGTAVYPLSLSSQRISNNSSSVFCISKPGADPDKLQSGLNWACGQGHANCSAIQPGQPCYYPDTVQNHASFAYNNYYQKMHSVGGTCDFDGTAQTTSDDPSYGFCTFTGSTNTTSSQVFPPTPSFGPIYQPSASSILGVAGIGSMILAVSVALTLI